MALQKINWLQIDTVPPSGTTVSLGSVDTPLENVFVRNLELNELGVNGHFNITGSIETTGDVVVGGNLTVRGNATIIDSTTVAIGDSVVELNGTESSFGGLLIKDPTQPNTISGSLLWDTTNDRWIAGPLGSELPVLLGGGTEDYIQKMTSNGELVDSRISDDGSVIMLSGVTLIRGDLIVEGKTTLVQTEDPTQESLVVSGAMSIVENIIQSQIVSASIRIQNLGSIGDPNNNDIIDLGGFF